MLLLYDAFEIYYSVGARRVRYNNERYIAILFLLRRLFSPNLMYTDARNNIYYYSRSYRVHDVYTAVLYSPRLEHISHRHASPEFLSEMFFFSPVLIPLQNNISFELIIIRRTRHDATKPAAAPFSRSFQLCRGASRGTLLFVVIYCTLYVCSRYLI